MVPPGRISAFAAFSLGVSLLIVLPSSGEASSRQAVRAVVESCPGCQLNRLPDVKAFIYDDLPLYGKKVEFKRIQGAPPELVFYNEDEEELERIKLGQLTRTECNELLTNKNFKKNIYGDEL